jgi:hypothetical protein
LKAASTHRICWANCTSFTGLSTVVRTDVRILSCHDKRRPVLYQNDPKTHGADPQKSLGRHDFCSMRLQVLSIKVARTFTGDAEPRGT